MGQLTVEQVLVISLVIKVSTVLLDGIDTKLGRIDSLGSQVVVLKVTTNNSAALLFGGSLGPEGLDVGTLGDEVPMRIRPSDMLCGLDQRRNGVHSLGGKHCDFIEQGLGFGGHFAKGGLVFLDLIGPGCGGLFGVLEDILGLIGNTTKDLLCVLLEVDGGGSADQQS